MNDDLKYITSIFLDHADFDHNCKDVFEYKDYRLIFILREGLLQINCPVFNWEIPYNELEDLEEVLPYFAKRVNAVLDRYAQDRKLITEIETEFDQEVNTSSYFHQDKKCYVVRLERISTINYLYPNIEVLAEISILPKKIYITTNQPVNITLKHKDLNKIVAKLREVLDEN